MNIMSFSMLMDVLQASSSIKCNLNPHYPRKWCMTFTAVNTCSLITVNARNNTADQEIPHPEHIPHKIAFKGFKKKKKKKENGEMGDKNNL